MAKEKAAQATLEAEPEYSIEELAAAADIVFHATPDVVTAALRCAGVEKTTKTAAIQIVETFRRQEV